MKDNYTKQDKTDRRCFLLNCAKCIAGAGLFGLTTGSFGNTKDDYTDYGYCMYRCPQPCSFKPSCKGCRENDNLTCTARACAIEREMLSCAHCPDLETCTKSIFVNYPSVRNFALRKQEQWGLLTNSIDIQKEDGFKLYPTTTNKEIHISNPNQFPVSYKIFDLNGKMMKHGSVNTGKSVLDVSHLISGHYIINIIKNKELLYVRNFIKR